MLNKIKSLSQLFLVAVLLGSVFLMAVASLVLDFQLSTITLAVSITFLVALYGWFIRIFSMIILD